ncbi:MAG: hypothetical protein JKY19_14405 [Alcanivoracaceae bacterium]|nr:hypothetical protein [Alcanivoracaceae bacterium]
MKFLSSIVRHSLQPSKKPDTSGFSANPVANTVTSQINQRNNKQSMNQTDSQPSANIAAINKKIETIKQKTQKLTDNSNELEINNDEQASTFPDKAEIEAYKNSKTTIHEISEMPTLLQDVGQFQNKSIIDKDQTKNKTEDKIVTRKNTVSKNIKPQKQEILQKQASTIKPKESSQARREPKQQAIIAPKQQEQQEQNNKHSYTDSITLKNTQQDTIKTEKQVHNNYYISRQNPVKPALSKTTKQVKTIQQTPPVRIGQINVLIEDQAISKPKASTVSKTQSSSPFGFRGL